MFSITTINHKTQETHHPLLLLTNREGYKYLFGKVSEGSQRVLNENKVRLTKLKGVFLTGTLTGWSEIGGLPGLFLTISDATKKDIDVYSTSSAILSYIVATWRYYVFRKGVELKINDVDDGKLISDSNILVKPIKIASAHSAEADIMVRRQLKKLVSLMFPLDTSKANDRDPSSYKTDPADQDIQTHVSISDLELQAGSQKAMNYLIRFQSLRGKFNPVKAKELGIVKGTDFRDLTQGISVTNPQGEVVTPDQVVGEPKYFKKVLMLDVPNSSYLENVYKCTSWFEKNDSDLGQEDIGVVYHILGDDINFRSKEYIDFINSFPSDCKHIISHQELSNNTIVFKTFASNLLKLRAIQRDHYNLPCSEPYDGDGINKLHSMQQLNIGADGFTFDNSNIFDSNWSRMYDEHIEPLQIEGADKQTVIDPTPLPLGLTRGSLKDNVHITTLGTGSALPSLYRNVLANLVRIPIKNHETGEVEYKTILLDGGENTLGSLLRTFGHKDQYQTILQELGMIFLSHLHADHHLGLVSILNKWFEVNKYNDKVLHLVLPWQFNHFIAEWYKLETQTIDLSRINYISCEDFLHGRTPEYSKISIETFEEQFDRGNLKINIPRARLESIDFTSINKMYKDMNMVGLRTCRALHCYWSYSVSIEFQIDVNETFKVSFSGDTRPNPSFVEIGLGSDLLIHEASLDNELIEEAIAKKHTTMIEAVNVARYMNCPKLILTHFSTRYSNGANFVSGKEEFNRLSNELKTYLNTYKDVNNIFLLEDVINTPIRDFNDMEILFAFDSLITRLSQVGDQKTHMNRINKIFDSGSGDIDEKELDKSRAKREVKRAQRLSLQKKRKTSSDEEGL
ncbi:ribonuclease Z [Yamadazyma tenuis]|uniref:ribonuclease Z n=1 Tax=Candida tenuis (strain ATCC 10573 / BCRC 21748 / CBS 615 / JCM 9827 / NBRC 10315 / NRRL Y-1498 / VKM Y-70) TaxID=590646 RepID=G3B7R3_CANTC|nr:uncharacterized protein CANTEDRAFT_95185 [Yamadazyma tenuis ATCC 10573]EGV62301.1 hypothetical protein CANTEDRAFT_95185 [Yamadazyma tenuis ATCC 10573]WEJ93560.1 ribonuclease Z [Yamadazyma tenuis]